ncbi:hypothetical protein FJU08_15125 [Martelella alba]|uniref:Uncharacterized protein n=1 Tax=Martelella alba TaxID=2590451 RepID=A0A506U5Q2_9HYPH|nr:hypothetical protein [Martelella alba]TPW29180.1 hypothetical protein FJU08_15125 [Martelella alba]
MPLAIKTLNDAGIAKCIADREKQNGGCPNDFSLTRNKAHNLSEWDKLRANSRYTALAAAKKDPAGNRHFKEYDNINIVHMIRHSPEEGSAVYHKNFQKLISSWDAVSCSLLDPHKKTKENPGTLAEVGFSLSVPAQNILGAHHADVWFANHAGAQPQQKYVDSHGKSREPAKIRAKRAGLLAKATLNDISLKGPVEKQNKGVTTLTDVASPKQVLEKTMRYNELIAIGRPDVNVYKGMGVSRPIKVNAIVINPNEWQRDRIYRGFAGQSKEDRKQRFGTEEWNKDIATRVYLSDCWLTAEKLRSVNPDLSILMVKKGLGGSHWDFRMASSAREGDGFLEDQSKLAAERQAGLEAQNRADIARQYNQVAENAYRPPSSHKKNVPNHVKLETAV